MGLSSEGFLGRRPWYETPSGAASLLLTLAVLLTLSPIDSQYPVGAKKEVKTLSKRFVKMQLFFLQLSSTTNVCKAQDRLEKAREVEAMFDWRVAIISRWSQETLQSATSIRENYMLRSGRLVSGYERCYLG